MSKKVVYVLSLICTLILVIAPTVAQDDALLFPIGEGEQFNWESYETFADTYDLEGEVMTMFGPWINVDEVLFRNVIAYFEAATGVDVLYAGSDSFEQQIDIEVRRETPPNIAVFPQPGLAADFGARDVLVPLSDDDRDWILENYAAGQSWLDLGTFTNADGNEQLFGLFYKVDVKSLVWYLPGNFAEAGYDVPQTMEELLALSEQIVEDGGTPWCIGLGSGDATGWPATDWVEDILLRTAEPSVYDAWITNELAFDDPVIVNALEIFGQFAKQEAWVNGGVDTVATTDFRESPLGLFTEEPGCFMHRQASFIPSNFPDRGAELAEGVADFFYFPPFEEQELGNPVLGAGTVFTIMDDSPAARAWIDFLQTPIAHEVWMAQTGFLTPLISANPDAYANDTLRDQGEILTNATTFRFDGSDLMPGLIGASAFWRGMIDFVNGASAETVAAEIQAAWDDL